MQTFHFAEREYCAWNKARVTKFRNWNVRQIVKNNKWSLC